MGLDVLVLQGRFDTPHPSPLNFSVMLGQRVIGPIFV